MKKRVRAGYPSGPGMKPRTRPFDGCLSNTALMPAFAGLLKSPVCFSTGNASSFRLPFT